MFKINNVRVPYFKANANPFRGGRCLIYPFFQGHKLRAKLLQFAKIRNNN